MNNYCSKIEFNLSPLIEGYDLFSYNSVIQKLSLDIINPKLKDLLDNLGITISWLELFVRQPWAVSLIHTDRQLGDFTKINFIFKGSGSYMNWYTPKDIAMPKKNSELTATGTTYTVYNINEVDIVHKQQLLGSYLVQVGTPHSIVNLKEKRYCLCMIIVDKETGSRLPMIKAQQLLSEYILD